MKIPFWDLNLNPIDMRLPVVETFKGIDRYAAYVGQIKENNNTKKAA